MFGVWFFDEFGDVGCEVVLGFVIGCCFW